MWYNSKKERYWVKYHFKTNQGIKNITQEEADKSGTDADYHRRDLFEAIKQGNYPSWRSLSSQIMPFKEAETYRFNPFDLTKVWPHGGLSFARSR